MNNTAPPLGPAPAPEPVSRRSLSKAQAVVLEQLRCGPQQATAVAEALGLHPNTARGHLDALVDDGLVRRARAAATGRGRPAWLYVAVEMAGPDPRLRNYMGLAMAFAAHLQCTAADPASEAVEIGRAWGRELAGSERGAGAPAERVVELLDGLGFAPSSGPDGESVALRRCPLLAAARRHPEVVCRVHRGLVYGALEVFGGEPVEAQLVPFAEPGFCRLDVAAGEARGNR